MRKIATFMALVLVLGLTGCWGTSGEQDRMNVLKDLKKKYKNDTFVYVDKLSNGKEEKIASKLKIKSSKYKKEFIVTHYKDGRGYVDEYLQLTTYEGLNLYLERGAQELFGDKIRFDARLVGDTTIWPEDVIGDEDFSSFKEKADKIEIVGYVIISSELKENMLGPEFTEVCSKYNADNIDLDFTILTIDDEAFAKMATADFVGEVLEKDESKILDGEPCGYSSYIDGTKNDQRK